METVDAELVRLGSTPLQPSLPWKTFEYLADGDHFTWESHLAFLTRLGEVLTQNFSKKDRVLLITDSTVEHHESSLQATARLREYVPGIEVDALCGSGFVALTDWNSHFRGRLARRLRGRRSASTEWTAVVVMGGWNDASWSPDVVLHAVRGFVSLVHR